MSGGLLQSGGSYSAFVRKARGAGWRSANSNKRGDFRHTLTRQASEAETLAR